MSEIYNIKEIPDGTFPIYFNLIYLYHQEDPILIEKFIFIEYQTSYFSGIQNNIELVRHKDKTIIPKLIQKYVVKWYHTYVLRPVLD